MKAAMQTGLIVALILAVLTIAEYIFAIQIEDNMVRFIGLAITAIGKAVLIVYFFMHINRVWRPSEVH